MDKPRVWKGIRDKFLIGDILYTDLHSRDSWSEYCISAWRQGLELEIESKVYDTLHRAFSKPDINWVNDHRYMWE